jgi:hypothetical protein
VKQFINHSKVLNLCDAPKDAKEEGKKDDNVVDADFEEVKDENKEKSA